MRNVLRRILYLAGGLLGLTLLVAGWVVYRALPEYEGTASLPPLGAEVIIERDSFGVARIRAASLLDAATAQGYLLAQDRLWQMDLIRRAAAGELSEIFGPATLETDREARTLGFRAAAERDVALLDDDSRRLLEAYAAGVNSYLEQRRGRLPWEFTVLRYEPRPWTPRDTLLVAAYMYRVLASSWRSELNRARVTARLGEARARELYVVDSPLDRYLVGGSAPTLPRPRTELRPVSIEDRIAVSALSGETVEDPTVVAGSNNWVVSGAWTYSGKPLLANDTHLSLELPCIWYLLQITAPGWNVRGFALPGVPLIIIGHNERIAWGFTNNGADVQDLYVETFRDETSHEYLRNGRWVAAEVRREVIRVRGQDDVVHDVLVTAHGPVVVREGSRGYAMRWVATEPGGLGARFFWLGRARNWEEFLAVSQEIVGPAQNTVYADVDGNIGYVLPARVPIRRQGNGAVPMAGETDDHDWIGYIPFAELPQVLNPREGILVTANARVVGPSYPHHLTENWVAPHRTARIHQLLEEQMQRGEKFRPEDFLRIQTDVLSLPHLTLARALLKAAEHVPPRDPRLRTLLDRLQSWDGLARVDSVETAFADAVRRELLERLLTPHLGEQTQQYSWFRSSVFLENILQERPAHWLPEGVASYDALLLAAAEAALEQLATQTGTANPNHWEWGKLVPLEILHPLGRSGMLRSLLSIGPLPQPGTPHTVKQTGRRFGPAMRFVADTADWDNSILLIPTGQSGQWPSPHYRDQFPAWFEGRALRPPFSDAAWQRVRRHTLRLLPD
jgi:penicillin amidase